ncbi:MAG: Na+/H+ antiporter NhaC family protein [Muribaculaceae bacterium]
MEKKELITKSHGLLAISPIAVFLMLYLVTSIAIGDFYKMPLSLAFIIASMWAIITIKRVPLTERISIFSRGAANGDVLQMIWIFILAGAFSSLAKSVGAIDAVVNLTLSVMPSQWLVPSLFIAVCFISLSIGTSVGTVVALAPLAVQLANATGGSVPFFVAVTLCGSFFGDNLSFISDTTIAATRSQHCKMRDKFRANLFIALPAAAITVFAFILVGDFQANEINVGEANPWLVVPYLIVIVTAILGINVMLVLCLGIVSCIVLALFCTHFSIIDMCTMVGTGIDGMGNLIIVTLLASGLLEVIRYNGGIKYLIQIITQRIDSQRGAQACISVLVAFVNVCTANNTVAIISCGEISRRIGIQFGIDPRKVASLLDTCSCIVQCIIPYGAQSLLAAGIAKVSPVAFFPYLYYAWALALMVILSIVFQFPKRLSHRIETENK